MWILYVLQYNTYNIRKMLINNNRVRYDIPDNIIPSVSLLRIMLDTDIGLDKDEYGYIILNDVPITPFRAYVNYIGFQVSFDFDDSIAEWFDYLGHHNTYSYPLDYWKIKLIDEHDKEFKNLGGIERIGYLTGLDPMQFIVKYGIKITNDEINKKYATIFDEDIPLLYYSDDYILFRYISIYRYHYKIVWFDINNMEHEHYIHDLLTDVLLHDLDIKFPLLTLDVVSNAIEGDIEFIYRTTQYHNVMSMNLFIERVLSKDKIIDVTKYDWFLNYEEHLRYSNYHMIEEFLADYLDRTEGTTLDKIMQYNRGDKYKIRTTLILKNIDKSELLELAKELDKPKHKDMMYLMEEWSTEIPSLREELDSLYDTIPKDTMSIILLVSKYGFDLTTMLTYLTPITNITLDEFYSSSPLLR